MQFLKSKIFLIILWGVILLFLLQFYYITAFYSKDTWSYIRLIEWSGSLITWENYIALQIDKKQILSKGDTIQIWQQSFWVIEWWDKSITRLWENTYILIKENFVSQDLDTIQISFELLGGKTWSNIFSIFWRDSYFHQEIKWVMAAVRGTVFEVNMEWDYIITHSHSVDLSDDHWNHIQLYPWKEFSLSRWSLEDLKRSIDIQFQNLNQKLDREYLEKLRTDFMQQFYASSPFNLVKYFDLQWKTFHILENGNFEEFYHSLWTEKQTQVLKYLEKFSQNINFENGEDRGLFTLKQEIQNNFLKYSTDDIKKSSIIRQSLYDFIENGKETTDMMLERAKQIFENQNFIERDILNHYGYDMVNNQRNWWDTSIDLSSFNQWVKNISDVWEQKVHSFLDAVYNFILKLFQ